MAPGKRTTKKSNPKAPTIAVSSKEPESSSSATIDPKITGSSEIPIVVSAKAQGKRPAQQEPEGSNKRATVAATRSSSSKKPESSSSASIDPKTTGSEIPIVLSATA